jgi:hypothetical protein
LALAKSPERCSREVRPEVGQLGGRPLKEGLMGSKAAADSAPQHLKALERANQVRVARAELKRKVASGDISVPHVLLARPWHAATMSISDLLMTQRSWGRTRSRRLLVSAGVPETKPIGTLTERQRTATAALLELPSDGD